MTGLPLWLRIAIAVVLALSTAVAFWGPAPRRARGERLWPRLAVLAATCYAAGCVALLLGAPATSAGFVAIGVEALAVAAWLGRGAADGGEPSEGAGDAGGGTGGPGGGPGGPGDPGGWTDDDERRFRDYAAGRPTPAAPGPSGRRGQAPPRTSRTAS